ncbi:hypothetical protein ACFL6Y_08830 [Elusimicrobiota bacterium]
MKKLILLLALITILAPSRANADEKKPALAEKYAARAIKHYQKGRTEKTLKYAKKAIKYDTDNVLAWKALGLGNMMQGQFSQALIAFGKSVELRGPTTNADKALLNAVSGYRLYTYKRQPKAAIKKFEAAAPLMDRLFSDVNATALYGYLFSLYGKILESNKEPERALKMYRKARRTHPRSISIGIINRLELLILTEKARKAEEKKQLRKAFNIYVKAFGAASQAGLDAELSQKKIIKLALKLDPKPATPKEAQRYVARGLAAIRMAKTSADYKDAIAEFEKALALAPWLATIYYNMGVVQERAQMLEDAIKSLQMYRLAAPRAKDNKAIEKKIFELEYADSRMKDFTWKAVFGEWEVDKNNLAQRGLMTYPALIIAENINKSAYTLTCQARNLHGTELVYIMFHYKNNKKWIWWNLGGWGNTKSALEYDTWGAGQIMGNTTTSDTFEGERWYDLKIVVDGLHFKGFIDNNLALDVEMSEYMSSSGSIGFATWGSVAEIRDIKIR